MRHGDVPRRFLIAVLLSQVIAVQGLLLAWSGALAFPGGLAGAAVGTICAAADSHGDGPGPAQPATHHDCLSACVAGHAGGVAGRIELPQRFASVLQSPQPSDATLLPLSAVHGFLARAPPVLI